MSSDEPPHPRRSTLPLNGGEPSRPRRSTIETFNEELAALERPLEGDVEYFDDKPPSRWRHMGAFAAIVAFVGLGGALLMTRHRATAAAPAAASAPSVPMTVAAVEPAAQPTTPAPAAPAPEVVAPAADEADSAGPADAPAAHDASAWRAPPRTAWAKVHTKTAGHPKHARAAGGKTTYRRTTTVRRHVVVKRTVAGRR